MNINVNDTMDTCCEPMAATVIDTAKWNESEIPYEVDFGFPRSIEELKAELTNSLAERSDPSKWMTDKEFWAEMKRDLAWL